MAQLKDLIVTGPSRFVGTVNINDLVANGTLNGFTLGKSVPADAKFTDTVYTLPAATSSTLGGVKVGTNISVSSGTISVANASTSAKGVVQLSSATNSTSTSLAATASAVKSAYDLAASKTANTGTITAVQANGTNVATSGTANIPAASTSAYGVTKLSSSTSSTSTSLAATASAVKAAYDLANGKQSPATTLAGYGITDAYTKSQADDEFFSWDRGAFNVNTLYDARIDMVAQGSNCPTGSQYGVCMTLPYRQFEGNTKPDFGAQIFIPNGDDNTHPNSMLFRTSLGNSWNSWNEVAVKYPTSTITASSTSITLKPETYYTITPSSASTRTFSFASAPSGVIHEYIVEINCSSYAPSIAFPSGIKWVNGTAPALKKGKKYVISFVNNLGVFGEF